MERLSTTSSKALFATAFAVAVWFALRPITAAEATLWNDLVRPSLRSAYLMPDAWSDWLYAVLAKRAAGLFRLSEFSLRLPAVLAGVVWLFLLPRKPIWVLAAAVPVALGWFSTATGHGVSLALCAAAWRWRTASPWLLGLAIAISPLFAVLLIPLAVTRGIERVAIPALTTAFILLIVPLSHAAWVEKPAIGSREEAAFRNAVQPLRGHVVELSAAPDTIPILEFYKARYRQRGWQIQPNLMDRGQGGGFQPLSGLVGIRYRILN